MLYVKFELCYANKGISLHPSDTNFIITIMLNYQHSELSHCSPIVLIYSIVIFVLKIL